MREIKLLPQHLPEEGKAKSIYVQSHEFCIIKKEGAFYVMDDSCPHAGASLGMGKCQNNWLICPKHDIRFNIETGLSQTERFRVKTYELKKVEDDYFILMD